MRSNPNNIKADKQLKEDRGYTTYSYKNCDSCNNFFDDTTYNECNASYKNILKTEYVWQSWLVYQQNITVLVWFYSESFAVFVGLSQDLCFVIYISQMN